MSQTRHTVDQIIAKLRRADIELGKGKTVPDACKVLGISEQTYYRWCQKYGGMQPKNLSHGFGFRLAKTYGLSSLTTLPLTWRNRGEI